MLEKPNSRHQASAIVSLHHSHASLFACTSFIYVVQPESQQRQQLQLPSANPAIVISMLRRALLGSVRHLSSMSITPVEDAMRVKVDTTRHVKLYRGWTRELIAHQITQALKPSALEIYNDSHLHAHHKAMQGSTSRETHFRVVITSDAFKSKMQPARHRMVYALLKEELEREGGVHALQLRTRTPEEEERQLAREKEERGEHIAEIGQS